MGKLSEDASFLAEQIAELEARASLLEKLLLAVVLSDAKKCICFSPEGLDAANLFRGYLDVAGREIRASPLQSLLSQDTSIRLLVGHGGNT